MAIAFIDEVHVDDGSLTNPKVIARTVAIGDAVVVVVDEFLSTVLSITDDGSAGGNTYTQKASYAPGKQIEIWGTIATKTATTITVTFVSGTVVYAIGIPRYSGVASFGNVGSGNTGTSTNPSCSAVLASANNYIVAGFSNLGDPGALTPQNGSIRISAYANDQGTQFISVLDNTSASSGSLTASYTEVNSIEWLAIAVELVATGGGGGGQAIIVTRSQIPVPGPRRTQIIMT